MENYVTSKTKPLGEPRAYHTTNDVFYNLKLSKTTVDFLFNCFKNKHRKHDKLIFQFYYPATPKDNSPTLGVYPMRSKNQCIKKKQVFNAPILDYHTKSAEPLTGRAQFLGDQELDLADLKKLIKESNEADAEAYEYLLFTAKFHDENPHIYYEVSVQPSTTASGATIPTDPSPPAPAR
ncbi:MAG TPA: hypothetical protein VLM16_03620 [Ginsengibacter sp.]|nr:hypothetical protein [Ginsengibacter sp.]